MSFGKQKRRWKPKKLFHVQKVTPLGSLLKVMVCLQGSRNFILVCVRVYERGSERGGKKRKKKWKRKGEERRRRRI